MNLAKVVNKIIDPVLKTANEFNWDQPVAYANWLAQSFHLTKYTTRFAALSAGMVSIEDEAMHMSAIHHLQDEIHHEKMAVRDIESLGFELASLPYLLETKLLIQAQYYFIGQAPISHYGFVIFLEQLAAIAGPAVAERVITTHGKKCSHFLVAHADLDQKHAPQIIKMIETQARGSKELGLVLENLVQTAELYDRILLDCERTRLPNLDLSVA